MRWLLVGLLAAAPCRAQMTAEGAGPQEAAVVYVMEMPQPPPVYRTWYADAEHCTGIRGSYDRVRWFVTPGPWHDGHHGALPTYGMWQRGHRITLNAPEALDSELVVHEIIHDLVSYADSFPDSIPHPKAFYGPGKCAREFHP